MNYMIRFRDVTSRYIDYDEFERNLYKSLKIKGSDIDVKCIEIKRETLHSPVIIEFTVEVVIDNENYELV